VRFQISDLLNGMFSVLSHSRVSRDSAIKNEGAVKNPEISVQDYRFFFVSELKLRKISGSLLSR
jgi:hypothetical protein